MKYTSPFRGRRQINRIKRAILDRPGRASREAALRDHALFVFGINSALRIGDLLSLSVGDVLAGKGCSIRIENEIRVQEGKTGNVRTFPLVEKIQEALKDYLRFRKDKRGLKPWEPLWASVRGRDRARAISRMQVYRMLNDAVEVANRAAPSAERINLRTTSIGCHSMRKTLGYMLYYEGDSVPLADIQTMYGHSSERITLRYLGITKEITDAHYRALNL